MPVYLTNQAMLCLTISMTRILVATLLTLFTIPSLATDEPAKPQNAAALSKTFRLPIGKGLCPKIRFLGSPDWMIENGRAKGDRWHLVDGKSKTRLARFDYKLSHTDQKMLPDVFNATIKIGKFNVAKYVVSQSTETDENSKRTTGLIASYTFNEGKLKGLVLMSEQYDKSSGLEELLETMLSTIELEETEVQCESHLKKFDHSLELTLKCLENSSSCESPLADVITSVKSVNSCLPAAPGGQGTGGGYDISLSVPGYAGCESEAKPLGKSTLYNCIARWKFAARQKYRLELPKDDCSSLLTQFISLRDAFQKCVSLKHPGKPVLVKVQF